MVSLFSGDDRSIRCQHKVDTWVRYQVGLELGNIDIQSTIETKGSSQGTNDLSYQTVQVGVSWSFNIQVTTADIVQSFVINLVGNIGVFQQGVDAQHGVVWFDDSGGDLRTRPDSEGDLGLLTVVDGQTFEQQTTQTGTGTTTTSVVYLQK